MYLEVYTLYIVYIHCPWTLNNQNLQGECFRPPSLNPPTTWLPHTVGCCWIPLNSERKIHQIRHHSMWIKMIQSEKYGVRSTSYSVQHITVDLQFTKHNAAHTTAYLAVPPPMIVACNQRRERKVLIVLYVPVYLLLVVPPLLILQQQQQQQFNQVEHTYSRRASMICSEKRRQWCLKPVIFWRGQSISCRTIDASNILQKSAYELLRYRAYFVPQSNVIKLTTKRVLGCWRTAVPLSDELVGLCLWRQHEKLRI